MIASSCARAVPGARDMEPARAANPNVRFTRLLSVRVQQCHGKNHKRDDQQPLHIRDFPSNSRAAIFPTSAMDRRADFN
jgi:hypothetical protein